MREYFLLNNPLSWANIIRKLAYPLVGLPIKFRNLFIIQQLGSA